MGFTHYHTYVPPGKKDDPNVRVLTRGRPAQRIDPSLNTKYAEVLLSFVIESYIREKLENCLSLSQH
jgi:hypothetical protein